jgi:hypothetical protein
MSYLLNAKGNDFCACKYLQKFVEIKNLIHLLIVKSTLSNILIALNMRKIYSLAFAALIGTALTAQNANVTFRVDMSGQTVGANGVHVAGDFQGPSGGTNWTPNGTSMTQVGTTGIYTATVTIPHGQYEFKFINGNDWPGVEGVPAICQKEYGSGNDNRVVNIFRDTTLAAVVFGGCSPAGSDYLMLRVDMNQQTVGANGVHVAGSFQQPAGFPGNWNPATTRLFNINNNGVYARAFYVPSGTYEYKFVNGNSWGSDESVPGACANANNNREVVLSGDQLVDVVPFGGCASAVQRYNLTLRVDMSATCIPFDSIDVAGGAINGWAGGDILVDTNGDDIYEGTVQVDAGNVVFKFRALVGGSPNWEGIPDRNITVTSDTTMPVACFNVSGFGTCPPVPPPADVIFRVDLSNEIPASAIYVIGDFTVPAWQGGAIQLTPTPGHPGVFETTIPNFCPPSFFYKFVNGDVNNTANEESFTGVDTVCVVSSGVGGFNRFFERTNADPVTLQYVFGKCDVLTIGLDEAFGKQQISLSPNPLVDVARLQLNENERYNLSIRDISGREVRQYLQVSGVVEIARGNLPAGIYMLQIVNERGEVNNSKITVK